LKATPLILIPLTLNNFTDPLLNLKIILNSFAGSE